MSLSAGRVAATLALALIAFAANSVLCREALLHSNTDAYTFTVLRLASGAIVLSLFVYWPRRSSIRAQATTPTLRRQAIDALWLVMYALPFSLAYRQLDTGTGALLLFGSVQLTMMLSAIGRGERPGSREWIGLGVAFAGLVYLVSPGVHAPDPIGAIEMVAAGVGWGLYSLAGQRSGGSPIERNGRSFLLGAIAVLPWAAVSWPSLSVDPRGMALAAASGSTASAVGYVLWYSVLPQLSTTRAALAQLTVPILAAFAGVLLLGERVSVRLLIASLLVLGALAFARSAPREGR